MADDEMVFDKNYKFKILNRKPHLINLKITNYVHIRKNVENIEKYYYW